MREVSLDYYAGRFGGVILSAPSEVLYSNQVGGEACNHPVYQGVFLPTTVIDVSCDAIGGCWGTEITPEAADKLDAEFAAYSLPFRVDRARLPESQECWVPVVVVDPADEWKDFVGVPGIYTTSDNCD